MRKRLPQMENKVHGRRNGGKLIILGTVHQSFDISSHKKVYFQIINGLWTK